MRRLRVFALALAAAVAGVVALREHTGASVPPGHRFAATVLRVVDGDTLIARVGPGGPERVRIIGADTPETVRPGTPVRCFGPQASAFAKRTLPAGTSIRAAYEPGGDRDRYGRLLWDVWLPDGRLLAAVLIADGYARAEAIAPQVRYAHRLAQLEVRARARQVGLWGPACRGHSFG